MECVELGEELPEKLLLEVLDEVRLPLREGDPEDDKVSVALPVGLPVFVLENVAVFVAVVLHVWLKVRDIEKEGDTEIVDDVEEDPEGPVTLQELVNVTLLVELIVNDSVLEGLCDEVVDHVVRRVLLCVDDLEADGDSVWVLVGEEEWEGAVKLREEVCDELAVLTWVGVKLEVVDEVRLLLGEGDVDLDMVILKLPVQVCVFVVDADADSVTVALRTLLVVPDDEAEGDVETVHDFEGDQEPVNVLVLVLECDRVIDCVVLLLLYVADLEDDDDMECVCVVDIDEVGGVALREEVDVQLPVLLKVVLVLTVVEEVALLLPESDPTERDKVAVPLPVTLPVFVGEKDAVLEAVVLPVLLGKVLDKENEGDVDVVKDVEADFEGPVTLCDCVDVTLIVEVGV